MQNEVKGVNEIGDLLL